ncbi:hypothetical protein GJ496_003051 [Pomphorhynchus laevis]|nr:hypothetical protein GJ496_003051 [Pomphorhynchus laevis]
MLLNISDFLAMMANLLLSILSSFICEQLLLKSSHGFIRAGLFGIDMCKRQPDDKEKAKKIPEAYGVLPATVYIVLSFVFIPIMFSAGYTYRNSEFMMHDFIQYLSALLGICSMTLLGFTDDVFNLRWRDKVLLPALASLPLLLIYFVNCNETNIVIPKLVNWLFISGEYSSTTINLGILYYCWMAAVTIFCTNTINILAGINGVEVGQSLIIASSIVVYNLFELPGDCGRQHLFSLYLLVPYICTTIPLLKLNWYPASVFVGDTFCYFSGFLFATVGILGHFSKTLMMFFIPQAFNFIISVPQLFRIVPCPRHRLPKLLSNNEQELLTTSDFELESKTQTRLQKFTINMFACLKLIRVEQKEDRQIITNMTILNVILSHYGPLTELQLFRKVMLLQITCSVLSLAIRYSV